MRNSSSPFHHQLDSDQISPLPFPMLPSSDECLPPYSKHKKFSVTTPPCIVIQNSRRNTSSSGYFVTFIIFTVLSLCSELTDAAARASAIHTSPQGHDSLVRSMALAQFKAKFDQILENIDEESPIATSKDNHYFGDAESSMKLPPSLRRKLEEEDLAFQEQIEESNEKQEEEREYIMMATPELLPWPHGSSKVGFYFQIPDEVPHETIQSAIVSFYKLSVASNYSLVFTSEASNETISWPLKWPRSCSKPRQWNLTRCSTLRVQIQPDIEHMLYLSGNIHSAFKLRFFLHNVHAGTTVDLRGVKDTPMLHLKYMVRTRSLRQSEKITQRECSSSPVEACCLVRSSVTLKELKWEDKVSTPFNIEFNYCQGSCIGTQDHYTTYNAFIRTALRRLYEDSMSEVKRRAFTPCCAPYSYDKIALWKRGTPSSWNRIILKDAKVTGCACV